MKNLAILEYSFLFDTTTTWQHGSQFEADLSDFFAANGFEATIIEPKGNSSRRILFIEKIEEMPKLNNTPTGPKQGIAKIGPKDETNQNQHKSYSPMPNVAPKEKVRAAERDFKQGKFLIRKGFLKR